MQVSVKMVGSFAKLLPENATGGVAQLEVTEKTSLSALARQLNVPTDNPCIVSVNDQIVPTAERDTRYLAADDHIKIIPPLKGG